MSTLPNDVARCHGLKWGNEKTGKPMPPCEKCQRRLQIAIDPPTIDRVVYTWPPQFENGICPIRIGE